MPKLSLIMPAYNAEKTCKAAIESVICTDFDLEVIVVDDGSNDKTFQICTDIQKRDARVKVYSQKNAGVSSARNYGLSLASGEYIGFIDSDDRVSSEYVDSLIPYMKLDMDIIVFGYSNLVKGERVSGWKPIETENSAELYHELLFHVGGLNSPWNKLFKHDLLHHTFNTQKSMGEDLEFCCEYLKQIKTCKAVPEELYLYNTDAEGSLTKKLDIVLDSVIEDMKVLADFTEAIGVGENIVAEKFYQRVEGILGSFTRFTSLIYAVNKLQSKNEFLDMLHMYRPNLRKNILFRNMLIHKKWKTMFGYLLCKRYVRQHMR